VGCIADIGTAVT